MHEEERGLMMLKRLASVVCFLVVALVGRTTVAEPNPCWIWQSSREAASDSVRFVKTFRTMSTANSAKLRFVPVSANLTIVLDGKVVGASEPYDPIQTRQIVTRLDSGEHEIVVNAKGVAGPSAFFLRLDIEFNDGTRRAIISDSSWSVTGFGEVDNLGRVDSQLMVPEHRRVEIDAVDNYEQWKQSLGAKQGANPASFLVAPGFEIQHVRSSLPHEDSWVSLVFDPHGRIIVAMERRGLLRMTLSPNGDRVTDVEVVNDTLEECRGLAFIGDDLYANANNSKGLYRLRHQKDQFAEPELVYASTGGVGHGRNDLAVGSDGKLYSIHGDSVDLPQDSIDDTSPLRDARRGAKTSEGHLLRIDPNLSGPHSSGPRSGNAPSGNAPSGNAPSGNAVEILAAGLRNPFGIDFNVDGEIFTYDADAEYDMGTPWYRPTRVSHLVTGGDYGWRGVTKTWPPYYPDHPDVARPNLDIGKGSPTAVKFGTRSNFPAPFRDALFVLDWAYGRIIAVHMMPRGSSYLMSAETFVKGRPLNVTDLGFAPDGDMYVVTGGRQTESSLYRIRYVGDSGDAELDVTPFQAACEKFAADSRRLRRKLEANLRSPPCKDGVAFAWKHLSSPDPWIRYAAANVLERHPIAGWQSRALADPVAASAVAALIALARSGERELYPAIVHRLNQIVEDDPSPACRLTALYAYWLCVESTDGLSVLNESLQETTVATLDALYPSRAPPGCSYPQNRLLSEILVKLGSTNVVSKTIRLLSLSTNQTEQMHYLYVLRDVRDGWTIESRRAFFSGLAQGRHYLGGAGMNSVLMQIRKEAIETLTDNERQQLGSLIEDTPPIVETGETKPRTLVQNWTVEDLLVGGGDGVARQGDPVRGAGVFASAGCIQCHRFETRGTLIGPDLTSVSHRFGRRDLLTSIIEPSRVIAQDYRPLQITTSDGKSYIGQAILGGDYRSPVLRLSTDPKRPFETVDIPKSDIETQTQSNVSWMPERLLDTFTKAQILDLMAYLESAP